MIEMDRIESLSKRIAEEFRPDRIILFGSYAYGDPTEDSDVDLLVIMPFRGKPVYKAIEILTRIQPKFPVDILVRTQSQIRKRVAMDDWFMQEIVAQGRVLYEATHS
ncbi:MAG TPA: nucleotidyltransferase domain-containing protein [Pyrinomonadaceae bacterium]|jgi:predicted nucleotidyltransferase|nr:nucleotidyltransferase domain-containing protein [Pyrinomonadaceae bacterium]